jgi:hypothetical protein
MVTVIKAPFVIALTRTIVGIKSRPQTPRGTELVNVHTKMPKDVNKVFAKQHQTQRKGGSRPPRPPILSRYFGLRMMDPGRPPLPPNIPYHRPLNYPKYVKDFDPNALVIIFKVAIRVNGEIEDVKIVNIFSFTLKTLCLIGVTIIWDTT